MKRCAVNVLATTLALCLWTTRFDTQVHADSKAADTSAQVINFRPDPWPDILRTARLEQQFIFVDYYESGCGPCQWMEDSILVSDALGSFYNQHFISRKLEAESDEGMAFAKQCHLPAGTPTFIFLDSLGQLAHMAQGTRTIDNVLVQGRRAIHPDSALFPLLAKYRAGDQSPQVILAYLHASKEANVRLDGYAEMVHDFLRRQPQQDLLSGTLWDFMRDYLRDIDDTAFHYVLAHRDQLEAQFGAAEVNHFIYSTELRFYASAKRWEEYSVAAVDLFARTDSIDPDWANSILWNFCEQVSDTLALARAQEWGAKQVADHPAYDFLDTYAHLWFKLGDRDSARVAAQKAIDVAQSMQQDHSATDQLLMEISK